MDLLDIQNGETKTLEFKKELPSDSSKWIKTIVAFANGAGGKLVIGVSNRREIVGVLPDVDIFALRDKVSDTIAQMCEPQVMFDIYQESFGDKFVVVVEVFPGNNTPYFIKSLGKENGTFVRLNATTRNADSATLDELELRKKRKSYDELPMFELDVNDDDINYLCDDFSKKAQIQISKEHLFNFRLLQKHENIVVATRAYAIFLGKHDYLSRIRCARFKGTDRVHFIDKKDFDGPLLGQIEGAYKFVLGHINMAVNIKGIVHDEVYELPTAALRELIINAAIHRNYAKSESVQVAVYDDRVEVSSPGGMFGSLTLDEALLGRSSIRNRIIASVCEKLRVVEGWGSGLKRVFGLCAKSGVRAPVFEEVGDMLRVNFYRPSFGGGENLAQDELKNGFINDLTNETTNLNAPTNDPKNLFDLIKQRPNGSYEDFAKILHVSTATIKRKIAELKSSGKIVRVGANKNGRWAVVA